MLVRLSLLLVLFFGSSTVFAKACKVENHGGLVGHQYSQPYKVTADNAVQESFKTASELLARAQELKDSKYCSFQIAASCSETMELNPVRTFFTVKIGNDTFSSSTNPKETREVLVLLVSLGICPSVAQ